MKDAFLADDPTRVAVDGMETESCERVTNLWPAAHARTETPGAGVGEDAGVGDTVEIVVGEYDGVAEVGVADLWSVPPLPHAAMTLASANAVTERRRCMHAFILGRR